MEYRINVNNKFAAIETEEEEVDVDPLDTLKKLQDKLSQKKTEFKKVSTTTKTDKQKVSKVSGQAANKASNVKNQKVVKLNNENKPLNESIETRPERNGARGARKGGFRRGRGGFEGGRREFDRHSGSEKTGVKHHDKREGAGAHNWGSVKDDINDHLANNGVNHVDSSPSKPEETKPALSAEEIAEKEAALAALAAEKEAEEKQMTLAEWKKMEEDKRVKAEFNIRKPNEGTSDPKWKKMYVLKKKTNEDEEEEEEESEEEEHEEKKTKNFVPINITFTDSRKQGNARRGGVRGGGRGGRGGRGGGRFGPDKSHNKAAVVPNVDDEKDFPSLS